MKGILRLLSLLFLAGTLALAACSDDDDQVGWVMFDTKAVFFLPGQSRTVAFESAHIRLSSLQITSKPDGWADPVIDVERKTLTVAAPEESDDEAAQSGTIGITAVTDDNKTVTGSFFASISERVDLSDRVANSYLLNRPDINYRIDVMHKGDGVTPLATARVELIWQSRKNLIQYLELADGKASFFIDNNGEADPQIRQGNAVIGAYDEDGIPIWSWHIWAVGYDPDASDGLGTVSFNGYEMMTRNLGALDNANYAPAPDAQSERILQSYGLYYQWGRKDPFIGPGTYRGAGNGAMYNESGSTVLLSVQETSDERGTLQYATQNPLVFIYVEDKAAIKDWMWPQDADYNVVRWADTKTLYDPCPYGWRVAPAAAFASLGIKEPLQGSGIDDETYAEQFGWTLTKDGAESLFIGAGRRIYTNGTIQNIYINADETPQGVRSSALYNQPWIGLYWTADTAGDNQSKAFRFWFDRADVTRSGVEDFQPFDRANGMQVRCVRDTK